MFRPKLFDTIKTYTLKQFYKDAGAGVVVGIVAIPLAIAFAIASGVSPEKGLITAVVAGFIVSAIGGSKVQIGGPTGAFIVIVYGIVSTYNFSGLVLATFMAGIMLILFGIAKLGHVIKMIPHPLIVGFTAGIALIIFTSQVKDALGLSIEHLPAGFIDKWKMIGTYVKTINWWSLAIAVGTIVMVLVFQKRSRVIPGSLVALIVFTVLAQQLHLNVETIGTRFGNITAKFSEPVIPSLSWELVGRMLKPAFTIALLAGIESLLSAVVADGMIGGNHRSNMELVAQGVANIGSAVFGGIPATGAIARTATNIKNGGRTPVAGIIHAITILIVMLVAARWTNYIPMSCLAGILVVVAYNMSEWENFYHIAKRNRADALVMITTFLLTVLFDLTLALEVGMVLAVFLFFKKMTEISNVSAVLQDDEISNGDDDLSLYNIPGNTQVFELSGPLFFGAAYKFKDSIVSMKKKPEYLIVRMRHVPVIDSTGLYTLRDVLKMCRTKNITMVISEAQPAVLQELRKTRLLFSIGKRYVTTDFDTALARVTQNKSAEREFNEITGN